MIERKFWIGFAVAVATFFAMLVFNAPVWATNTCIGLAFVFGLPAGILSMRRQWAGK